MCYFPFGKILKKHLKFRLTEISLLTFIGKIYANELSLNSLFYIYIYELFRVFDKLQIVSSHVYVDVISLLSIYVYWHIPGLWCAALRISFYLLHICFDDN